MKIVISLMLVLQLAVFSYTAEENRAVTGYIAQYQTSKNSVQKAKIVVQLAKLKSLEALPLFFRDLVYPLEGDRGGSFDRSNSDFLRVQIGRSLADYVSYSSDQLFSYFFAARNVIEKDNSRDVVLATMHSMAIWAKNHTDKYRMLLTVSIKRLYGKTRIHDRDMMTGIIEALGLIKQDTDAFKLLNSFLVSGLDNDLTRKVKRALASR
jgi:hypothetical protein